MPRSPPRRALTDDAELSSWLCVRVRLEPVVDGAIEFVFAGGEPERGRVLLIEPPHLLAYGWQDEVLRWQLSGDGDGCLLVLTIAITDPAQTARSAAGFHDALDALNHVLCYPDLPSGLGATPPFDEIVRHYTDVLRPTR